MATLNRLEETGQPAPCGETNPTGGALENVEVALDLIGKKQELIKHIDHYKVQRCHLQEALGAWQVTLEGEKLPSVFETKEKAHEFLLERLEQGEFNAWCIDDYHWLRRSDYMEDGLQEGSKEDVIGGWIKWNDGKPVTVTDLTKGTSAETYIRKDGKVKLENRQIEILHQVDSKVNKGEWKTWQKVALVVGALFILGTGAYLTPYYRSAFQQAQAARESVNFSNDHSSDEGTCPAPKHLFDTRNDERAVGGGRWTPETSITLTGTSPSVDVLENGDYLACVNNAGVLECTPISGGVKGTTVQVSDTAGVVDHCVMPSGGGSFRAAWSDSAGEVRYRHMDSATPGASIEIGDSGQGTPEKLFCDTDGQNDWVGMEYNSGADWELHYQSFTDGSPTNSLQAIPSTTAIYERGDKPDVTLTNDGSAVLFDKADGVTWDSNFILNTNGTYTNTTLNGYTTGFQGHGTLARIYNYFIGCFSGIDGDGGTVGSDIDCALTDSSGAKTFEHPTSTTDGSDRNPDVVTLGNSGRAVVAWHTDAGGDKDVRYQEVEVCNTDELCNFGSELVIGEGVGDQEMVDLAAKSHTHFCGVFEDAGGTTVQCFEDLPPTWDESFSDVNLYEGAVWSLDYDKATDSGSEGNVSYSVEVDGDPDWIANGGPAWITNNAPSKELQVASAGVGTHNINICAGDGFNALDCEGFTIQGSDNLPPTWSQSFSDVSLDEGDAWSLDYDKSTDPEGQDVNYNVDLDGASWITDDSVSKELQVASAGVGTHNVNICSDDGVNDPVCKGFTIQGIAAGGSGSNPIDPGNLTGDPSDSSATEASSGGGGSTNWARLGAIFGGIGMTITAIVGGNAIWHRKKRRELAKAQLDASVSSTSSATPLHQGDSSTFGTSRLELSDLQEGAYDALAPAGSGVDEAMGAEGDSVV